MKKEMRLVHPAEENAFLTAYPQILRTARRRLSGSFPDSSEDVAQRVMLKLWHWNVRRHRRWERTHFQNEGEDNSKVYYNNGDDNNDEENRSLHELSVDEWQRLANVAVRNEIKSFFSAKDKREVSLEAVKIEDEQRCSATSAEPAAANIKVEGNTAYEMKSQLCRIWKILINLSLREKYALLLKERALCNYLIASGCCKIKDITDWLELAREEFIDVYKGMPLSDGGIAALLKKKLRQSVTAANVTKARQRAKKRIRLELASESITGKDLDNGKNERAFNEGKT